MYIYNHPSGRLGNAIYRYIASIIFGTIYGNFIISDELHHQSTIIDDEYYITWLTNVKNNNIPQIDKSTNYIFKGFFQHDYSLYKDIIYEYILNHPHDKLWTDGNNSNNNNYNYPATFYESHQLIENTEKKYEIVIHLRLEDSILGNRTMNPNSLVTIINSLPSHKICIVVNSPNTELEMKYIDFFRNKYDIIVESNDPITDYQIMKNAKILITSTSTLSWCAALMGNTIETVYFPNIKNNRNYICESLQTPVKNTILYDYSVLDTDALYKLL